MIKLRCSNKLCDYCYQVSEKELQENSTYHSHCLICGSLLEVTNLEEIIKTGLTERVKEYIDKYFKEIGLEATLEMVERNRNQSCFRLYKEELERRGFKLKEN
jgi:predicted ATP-dependent endonuclease of OLD family